MTTLPQTTAIRLPRPAATTAMVPNAYPGGALAGGGQSQMTGADAWRVLRSNLWFILAALAISAVAGYAINWWLAKYHSRYTAMAYIQIQPTSPLSINFDVRQSSQDMGSLAIEQKTHVALLTHEGLLINVLKNPSGDIRKTEWFKSFDGNIFKAKEDLLDNLRVAAVPETKLVSVAMSYSNPADTKVIVEEIVSQHLRNQQEQSQNRILERSQMLNNQKQRFNFRLRDLGSDLRDKAIKLNIDGMGTPGRLSTREVELSNLLKQQFDLQTSAADAKSAFESTQQQIQEGGEIAQVQEMVDHDSDVLTLKSQLMQYDSSIAAQQQSLGSEHKSTQQIKRLRDATATKLEEASAQVRAKLTASYIERLRSAKDSAEIGLKAVADNIQQTKSDLGDLTYNMSQYLTSKDEEKAIREQLAQVQNQLEAIQMNESAKETGGVAWSIRPEQPDTPSFPKLPITMAVVILLGGAFAISIAFVRELTDTSVRSPRDIQRVGQMNILGIVPHEDDDPQVAGAPLPLVIFQAPHSVLAEQYRQLRSGLAHAASLDTTRSLLVTSPSPGDGKTTVACNLAAGLALNGRRILLVDANFRRPELHRIFSLANDTGFSAVLNSPDVFGSAVCQTQVPNLDVLPSGPRPTNSTELLESQLLGDFIERALQEYDHVVFDSGPLLFVSESVALAPRVDGVVTVVRARSNSRGLLQRMRDKLSQAKAEHLGVVLNAVRSQAGGYYNRNIKTYYAYSNGNGA